MVLTIAMPEAVAAIDALVSPVQIHWFDLIKVLQTFHRCKNCHSYILNHKSTAETSRKERSPLGLLIRTRCADIALAR